MGKTGVNGGLLVLDWGIGGLPLFQELRAALPGANLRYLSDSGTVPYGKLSSPELRKRLDEIADFSSGLGLNTIAVACNAMSSVLSAPSSRVGPAEVLSLIHSFLCRRLDPLPVGALPSGRRVGVIGGYRTIESGLYQEALKAAGNAVSACPTQGLSALIEAGDFGAIPSLLQEVIPALGDIDSLVLACTHYPAAARIIQSLYPTLDLIDPGRALFDECLSRLGAAPRSTPGTFRQGSNGPIYYTTGDPELSRDSAEKAFGFAGLPFHQIPLDLHL
jgi:glutamate racemase